MAFCRAVFLTLTRAMHFMLRMFIIVFAVVADFLGGSVSAFGLRPMLAMIVSSSRSDKANGILQEISGMELAPSSIAVLARPKHFSTASIVGLCAFVAADDVCWLIIRPKLNVSTASPTDIALALVLIFVKLWRDNNNIALFEVNLWHI